MEVAVGVLVGGGVGVLVGDAVGVFEGSGVGLGLGVGVLVASPGQATGTPAASTKVKPAAADWAKSLRPSAMMSFVADGGLVEP